MANKPVVFNGASISVISRTGKALTVHGRIDPSKVHPFFKCRTIKAVSLGLAENNLIGDWLTGNHRYRTVDDLPRRTLDVCSTQIVFSERFIAASRQTSIPLNPVNIYTLPGEIEVFGSEERPILLNGSFFKARALNRYGIVKYGLEVGEIGKSAQIIKSVHEPLAKQSILLDLEIGVEGHEVEQAAAAQLFGLLRNDGDLGILALGILVKLGKADPNELLVVSGRTDLTALQRAHLVRGLIFCNRDLAIKKLNGFDDLSRTEILTNLLRDPSDLVRSTATEIAKRDHE